MQPIHYLTKRLSVQGEQPLTRLAEAGMWRQLTQLARNDSADTFFRLNTGVQPADFKGVPGFFRKFLESAKVTWAKLTGHLQDLIQKSKQIMNTAQKPESALQSAAKSADEAVDALKREYESLKESANAKKLGEALDKLTGEDRIKANNFWHNIQHEYGGLEDGGIEQTVAFLKSLEPDFSKHPPLQQIRDHFGEGIFHL